METPPSVTKQTSKLDIILFVMVGLMKYFCVCEKQEPLSHAALCVNRTAGTVTLLCAVVPPGGGCWLCSNPALHSYTDAGLTHSPVVPLQRRHRGPELQAGDQGPDQGPDQGLLLNLTGESAAQHTTL